MSQTEIRSKQTEIKSRESTDTNIEEKIVSLRNLVQELDLIGFISSLPAKNFLFSL